MSSKVGESNDLMFNETIASLETMEQSMKSDFVSPATYQSQLEYQLYKKYLEKKKNPQHYYPTKYYVSKFYENKVMMVTGCTGYVGKVILEKLLRSVPKVKKVFVLIRPNKKMEPSERLQKTILDSPIMNRIIKERFNGNRDEFKKYANEKLVAVEGDVSDDDLIFDRNGKNKELFEEMIRTIQVVLHSAATVGFHERLDKAIGLNTFGSLRVMKFARLCINCEVFCHISTCYTNSNTKSGTTVEEKQYDFTLPNNETILQFCKRILEISNIRNKTTELNDSKFIDEEINRISDKYLKLLNFPNTYTFTKNMSEKILMELRGDLPICVLRPSVIGASVLEPEVGWCDAVSAGSAVFLLTGLGITKIMPAKAGVIADNIPVDFVSNSILVSSCAVATENKDHNIKRTEATKTRIQNMGLENYLKTCRKTMFNPDYLVKKTMEPKGYSKTFHCGSSSRNPVSWGKTSSSIVKYWQNHKAAKAIDHPSLYITRYDKWFELLFYLNYTLLTKFFELKSNIFQSKDNIKLSKLLKLRETRARFAADSFKPFTMSEWIFDATNLIYVVNHMTPEDQLIFNLDFSIIEWQTYFQYNCYGLHKYILKENPNPPTQSDISKKFETKWFNDIQFAYGATAQFNNKHTREQLKQLVLASTRVQNAIQQEAEKRSLTYSEVELRGNEIMERMFANPNPSVVRTLSWVFRKLWRNMYQSIIVDEDQIEKLQRLFTLPSAGSVIFIPTHRSYMDFLILSYVFFAYSLPVPHIAAGEHFLSMIGLRSIFRKSGAFFFKQDFQGDSLYESIFSQYVRLLLQDGCPIEFFVEGTRSRNGKTSRPRMGLLSIISDSFLNKDVSNLTIVPVNIAYEKIIESNSLSNELLGKKKIQETLGNLFKARTVFKKNHGVIDVRFAKPISMKSYVEEIINEQSIIKKKQFYSSTTENENIVDERDVVFDPYIHENDKQVLVKQLAHRITFELNKSSITMPTSLVSAILLMYRNGISKEVLLEKVQQLKDEISERGHHVRWTEHFSGGLDPSSIVDRSIDLLKNSITEEADILKPNIKDKDTKTYKSLIELSTYKNNIVHIFVKESIVCCAIESLKKKKKSISEFLDYVQHKESLNTSSNIENLEYGKEGLKVSLKRVLQRSKFLGKMLQTEFVYKEDPEIPEDFERIVNKMVDRSIIKVDEKEGTVSIQNYSVHQFLCSLISSFIESYWIAGTVLLSLSLSTLEKGSYSPFEEDKLMQNIQWLSGQMFLEGRIVFFESCNLETLKNAILSFVEWGILSRGSLQEDGLKRKFWKGKSFSSSNTYLRLEEPYTKTDELLKFVESLNKYRLIVPGYAENEITTENVASSLSTVLFAKL